MIRQPSNNLQADLNNPYLLAWAQPDEPSNTTTSVDYGRVSYDPAEIEAMAAPWRAAAEAAGKYMPVIANHVGMHVYENWAENSAIMHDYMEGSESDWLSADSYPIQSGRSMLYDGGDYTSTEMGISAYRQVTWSGGKSTMTFIGTSAWNAGQDVPTPAEFKAQAWSAIINGADGIVYFPVALTPQFEWDTTPATLVSAMKELHSEIGTIDTVLINETSGGRDPYTVIHASNPGVAPKTGQLPFPFEATEIQNEQGVYRIVLNLSDQPAVLNKPEWNLYNVTFDGLEAKRGFFQGVTASGGNDTLIGDSGNNVLNGGKGADMLRGLSGNDLYMIDNSGDTVDEGAAGSGGVDTVQSSISFSLTNSTRLLGVVENLTLTGTGNIDANGNALTNALLGNSGNNVFKGGAGGDRIDGGSGVDTASYEQSTSAVNVNLSAATASGGDAAADVLVNIENLAGSRYSDVLVGNTAANVLRDGGGAADSLSGLGGNDVYQIYSSTTSITNSAGQGDADRVMAGVSYALGTGDAIELLTTNGSIGTSSINLTGNEFGQTIIGNSGANRIDGKGGVDVLKGLGGPDTFVFSSVLDGVNVDQVADFKSVDTIELENAVFKALTAKGTLSASAYWSSTTGAAHDASDRIIYETDTGKLYYDADGTGAVAAIHFATLTGMPALTNADFVVA